MLTFTQQGDTLLSGGYLIGSELLYKNMGTPIGLQVGGELNNNGHLSKNVSDMGLINCELNDALIKYAVGGKIKEKKEKKVKKVKKVKKEKKVKKVKKEKKEN